MITVILRTFIIYVALNVALRVLGKRQIGELEIAELVSTLLLSELATTAISDPSVPLAFSLLPIMLIMSLELLTSDVKNRSPVLKRIFEGSPGVLIRRGVLDQTALRKMRISVEELLSAFRLQGIVSIADVYYAILEQNGQLSVVLRKEKQQPTAEELALPSKETGISHAIIVDGQIKKEEMTASGRTSAWLKHALQARGVAEEEVFLLTVDDGGEITCILKEKKNNKKERKK
ncbi:MAG: DUF421 domain-containing protein [Ruminococcaceae bacterium]|nr:DUF421 domain-containing protein [Oscillospiraceae bacterium]